MGARGRGTLDQLVALANEGTQDASGGATTGGSPAGSTPSWPGTYLVWPHTPPLRGAAVRMWQTQISRRYSVTVDGVYGPESRRACIALQREMGLEPDGIVGPTTWAATFARADPKRRRRPSER